MAINILITRPEKDAEILGMELNRIGFDTVIYPILKLVDLNSKLPNISDFLYIIISSKNGVRVFANKYDERDICLYVIGEGSAEEAYKQGFNNVIIGGKDAADLCKKIKSELGTNSGKFLYISAVDQSYDITSELRDYGYNIEKLVLYEVIAKSNLDEGLLNNIEDGIIDCVLFFSPRSAAIFSSLIKKAGKGDIVKEVRAFCISRSIAKKANELKWKMVYVSAEPNKRSLIELLKYTYN